MEETKEAINKTQFKRLLAGDDETFQSEDYGTGQWPPTNITDRSNMCLLRQALSIICKASSPSKNKEKLTKANGHHRREPDQI